VEFSTGVNLFQYLFKYFFKSLDQANWKVTKQPLTSTTSPSTRKPIDEIRDYERGRYLSSIEAADAASIFPHFGEEPRCQTTPRSLTWSSVRPNGSKGWI
jgi:hypothetical protein